MNQIAIGNFIEKKRKEQNLTQALENQRTTLIGILLIVMGMALGAMSFTIGGSDVKDFFSGIMMGLSTGSMLVGVFVAMKSVAKRG